MKRWIALVGSVLAVFVVAAGPVAAAPSAPPPTSAPSAATNAVPANALGLAISNVKGNGIAVSLDPGGSQSFDLVLSNRTSNLRLTARLTATDAAGTVATGAGQWLAFGSDAVSLDPHAVVTVPLTVAVPHATPPSSVLAHIIATVETAISAADGSPRAGTTKQTIPVSITVQGSPTAQIAIADVHRVDQGNTHQLALVLRNFSDQNVVVRGTIKVLTTTPQNLAFNQSLGPERDTTVNLDWNAPPEGTGVDIAVDAHYGPNDVATWSSTLGGPPTTLVPNQTGLDGSTATTVPGDTSQSTGTATAGKPGKPWYDGKLIPLLIVLALLGAGAWFVWEFRRSKDRERDPSYAQPFFMMGNSGSPDATAELAKQLVRLTEIIVELTTNRTAEPGPARGPDPPAVWMDARAGPAPPGAGSLPDSDPAPRETATPDVVATAEPIPQPEPMIRPAAPPPDAEARPEPEPAPTPQPEPEPEPDPQAEIMQRLLALEEDRKRLRAAMDEPDVAPRPEPEPQQEPDPQAELMQRLVALDEDRRRLRAWMDDEDAVGSRGEEWPSAADLEAFRAPAHPDEEDES